MTTGQPWLPENHVTDESKASKAQQGALIPTPIVHVTILVIYLLAVVILTAIAAYSVWPSEGNSEPQLVRFVLYMGILGACLHAMTSIGAYIGVRKFDKSWTAWYLLRPLIGGALAWVVYLVFRGGLFKGNSLEAINPYTFGALGALSGMFSEAVTNKLGQLISVVFNLPTNRGAAAAPVIESVSPDTLSEKDASTKLKIAGTGFDANTVVELGGKAVAAKTVSATSIEADVPSTAFAGQKSVDVRVRNEKPTPLASNTKSLKVTPP
jgi:hypothetical protein